MPVHAHDGAEGLEPEGVRQTTEKLLAAVMVHDRFAHDSSQARHPLGEPFRDVAPVQR